MVNRRFLNTEVGFVKNAAGFELGFEVEHSKIMPGKVGRGHLLSLFLPIALCASKEPVLIYS